MPRIPPAELERLKAEVSVVRLAEARGVELKRRGKEMVGRCPFHEDETPSLSISPALNVWRCFGCEAGGSVVDWVMKAEGVTVAHALEILRAGLPEVPTSGKRGPTKGLVPKRSTVAKLPGLASADAEDQVLLAGVVEHYHQALKASPEALAYLSKRGLGSMELIEKFRLGYANRTLGYRLPAKNRKEGSEIRGRLTRLGVFRESGHEHLAGSLVVPITDHEGKVTQLYGRKILGNLRAGTPQHLYLPGPRKSVWNLEGLRGCREIILCEALLDAMTFWVAGYRNVTTAYGVNGLPDDFFLALGRCGTERVLIAFDRDEAGEKGAEAVARRVMGARVEAWRVEFPRGMDANEYARKVQPAAQSLGLVLRSAVWLGKGEAPSRLQGTETQAEPLPVEPVRAEPERATPVAAASAGESGKNAAEEGKGGKERTVKDVREGDLRAEVAATPAGSGIPATEPVPPVVPAPPARAPDPPLSSAADQAASDRPATVAPTEGRAESAGVASVLPLPPAAPVVLERQGEVVLFRSGDRTFRIRGLEKNTSAETLRVNVRATRPDGRFHSDTLDLAPDRPRQVFAKRMAEELGLQEETARRDVARLLALLETARDEQIRKQVAPKETSPTMSEADRAAALELLRSPDLLDQVLRDFERCGVVGETTNKLVGYLAAVSRKLERPLAIIIQSSSAAGKSSLMEAILRFVPEEEKVTYSAMTGQALFYMQGQNLTHKALAISEEEGAERASYALKLLQSEGVLTIISTGKDPATGKQVAHEYRVEGPVMLFLTTTRIQMDAELLNRCLVLSVDESREQTERILARQRQEQTFEGMLEVQKRPGIWKRHQDAQRLLRPLKVVNPYAGELTFQSHQTRARRDHPKYLHLIRSLALLHQHQREVRTVVEGGAEVSYVEVTRDDIAVADRLMREVLGKSSDELPYQTRRVLATIAELVQEKARTQGIEPSEVRFTRREVRERTGIGHTQTHTHIQRLEELEYLLAHGGGAGQRRVYELLHTEEAAATSENTAARPLGSLPTTAPASSPISCDYDGNRSGAFGGVSGGIRAEFGGVSAPPNLAEASHGSGGAELGPGSGPKTHYRGNGGSHPSRTDGPVVAVSAAALEPRGNEG